MKKMFKVIATVAAILSMANFVACKSDDDGDDEKVAVTSVTLNQSTATVEAGKTVTLTATVAPENATNKTVTWASSNTGIATVDGGVVTGVAAGEATITATADGKSATATITVTAASTDSGDSGSTDSGSGDSGSSETTKVLDVVYDLTTGLPSGFPTSDTLVSATWAAPTATPSTNDITWTWVATTNRKAKSNNGLQISNGTGAEDIITLSADSSFTVTITYKFAGTYDATKIRCLSAGDQSVSMESTTDKDTTYTLTTSAAKSVTIAANGMKITKIETKASE